MVKLEEALSHCELDPRLVKSILTDEPAELNLIKADHEVCLLYHLNKFYESKLISDSI